MEAVTMEDRRKELASLLQQMEAHPERDWSEEKARANVLREMLARHENAGDCAVRSPRVRRGGFPAHAR